MKELAYMQLLFTRLTPMALKHLALAGAFVAVALQAADTPAPVPAASSAKAAMVAEMQAAVNAIAIKHGNIPFTQIFTNEPERALAVRKRFMEIERADALAKQLEEMERRAKALEENVQVKEALLADLQRRTTAAKLEQASASAIGGASSR